MSNIMKIGTRVLTLYGWGTVTGFERIVNVKLPIEHPINYLDGDRIEIALDVPEKWACHSETSGNPYFHLSDLLDWE